jgi:hypothetical protein
MQQAPVLPQLLKDMRVDGSDASPARDHAAVRVLCRTQAQANAAVTVPWLDEVIITRACKNAIFAKVCVQVHERTDVALQIERTLIFVSVDSQITLDFLEVHGLVEAVASVKASGKRCVVATPRVLKPDEVGAPSTLSLHVSSQRNGCDSRSFLFRAS